MRQCPRSADRGMRRGRTVSVGLLSCARRRVVPLLPLLAPPLLLAVALLPTFPLQAQTPAPAAIRVNHVGYLPDAPKVAVVCATGDLELHRFTVETSDGRVVLGPARAVAAPAFGPCTRTWRLDFTRLRTPGTYRLRAGRLESPPLRVGPDVYAGTADTLLLYMRQQRSGWNPTFRDSVHHRTDGILVDHPTRAGEYVPVAGGWADAADYLQYVTTSATAVNSMLLAWRDHPAAFGDAYDRLGRPGANGIPDVLDEARWGLEWLDRMFPEDSLLLNQLGDDRDHAFPDLPPTDSSDYGWGRGGFRPVYPCTGEPQGLLKHRNRSAGKASTAGKFASAMALGAGALEATDPEFAARLRARAEAAYRIGQADPGACQTAPAAAPYFYEEDDWADDMELAAAALHALTGDRQYRVDALAYAAREPVSGWMGRDTARHYQFFPWHNHGHHEAARGAGKRERELLAGYYRRGLEAVAARTDNGFRVGIPFIWCSNDLMAALAVQAMQYRRMTGDSRFREMEQAAVDWLFGTNPWGVSMVVGYPAHAPHPTDPHSILSRQIGNHTQKGGLVDGPVYRSIFENLMWFRLYEEDEYAPWNTGHIVYHDDYGDYSTNEPVMDGTALLIYVVSGLR